MSEATILNIGKHDLRFCAIGEIDDKIQSLFELAVCLKARITQEERQLRQHVPVQRQTKLAKLRLMDYRAELDSLLDQLAEVAHISLALQAYDRDGINRALWQKNVESAARAYLGSRD